MLQTTPLPPVPPPGFDPVFMGGMEDIIVAVVGAIAFTIVAIKVLGPLARAWARRLEGKAASPELRAEIDQLRDQLGEVDDLRHRVHELEERVEFAERLLAAGSEPKRDLR